MKHIKYFCIILFLCLFFSLPCPAQPLTGLWENSERFIEYTDTGKTGGTAEDTMRIVLKTYYRFVYDDMGTYPVAAEQENTGNVYSLRIRYPGYKTPVPAAVWVHGDGLFTSFYKKVPHALTAGTQTDATQPGIDEISANPQPAAVPSSATVLEGFWVEQGFRNGILIYQQEAPVFFDAFFFHGTQYIRFRYWTGDFEYKEKRAGFVCDDGSHVSVPKFIRQYDAIYSCITDNGSKLKNYEKGTVSIDSVDGVQRLTLTPQGGGPGTHAVGDVYPHQTYPKIQALPLYYDERDGAFAFGEPFLTRSPISNLQEEITRHNSLKRPPQEPLLKADELDFYWDRIKEIRKQD
ncbi:hypothetical protein E4N71_00845 [Treponema vincentii]|uniref:hypothetical protein n=1 Tax=Treponema vincentii TaxID=69710 RepID=UPI003D94B842